MIKIPLYNGKKESGLFAIVDDEDYESLSSTRWRILRTKWGNYAKRYECSDGGAAIILMHRQLLNPPKGMMIDHINGDGLDNRRSNIRIVTPSENNYNRKDRRKDNSSGFTGVHFIKNRPSPWVGRVQSEGKVHYTSRFRTAVEAAIARDRLALEIQGEMAYLNFP